MPERPETLPVRIEAALDGAAATAALGALYFEAYGQTCYQRPRLVHLLSAYLRQHPPRVPARPTGPLTPRIMGYKFKDAFADTSAIVHYPDRTKEVNASNVTAEDAERLIANGQGHLLEEVSDADADAATKAAKPELSTRTSGDQLAPDPEAGLSDVDEHALAEKAAREAQQANEDRLEAQFESPA